MDTLFSWTAGEFSSEARVWTTLAPALVLSAYFLLGLLVYTVRFWFKGRYRDPELEARPATALTGVWIRLYFAWLMQPLWRLLVRIAIPPTAVTTLSRVVIVCPSKGVESPLAWISHISSSGGGAAQAAPLRTVAVAPTIPKSLPFDIQTPPSSGQERSSQAPSTREFPVVGREPTTHLHALNCAEDSPLS